MIGFYKNVLRWLGSSKIYKWNNKGILAFGFPSLLYMIFLFPSFTSHCDQLLVWQQKYQAYKTWICLKKLEKKKSLKGFLVRPKIKNHLEQNKEDGYPFLCYPCSHGSYVPMCWDMLYVICKCTIYTSSIALFLDSSVLLGSKAYVMAGLGVSKAIFLNFHGLAHAKQQKTT